MNRGVAQAVVETILILLVLACALFGVLSINGCSSAQRQSADTQMGDVSDVVREYIGANYSYPNYINNVDFDSSPRVIAVENVRAGVLNGDSVAIDKTSARIVTMIQVVKVMYEQSVPKKDIVNAVFSALTPAEAAYVLVTAGFKPEDIQQ